MSGHYRVTLPESHAAYDPQIHTDVTYNVKTVLWRGETAPDANVIDTLLEGQIERARQPQGELVQSATYLNIERMRRLKLGWYVVDRINIPGA